MDIMEYNGEIWWKFSVSVMVYIHLITAPNHLARVFNPPTPLAAKFRLNSTYRSKGLPLWFCMYVAGLLHNKKFECCKYMIFMPPLQRWDKHSNRNIWGKKKLEANEKKFKLQFASLMMWMHVLLPSIYNEFQKLKHKHKYNWNTCDNWKYQNTKIHSENTIYKFVNYK